MMISWWRFADCLGCRWVIERGWELVSREVYHSQGEIQGHISFIAQHAM